MLSPQSSDLKHLHEIRKHFENAFEVTIFKTVKSIGFFYLLTGGSKVKGILISDLENI